MIPLGDKRATARNDRPSKINRQQRAPRMKCLLQIIQPSQPILTSMILCAITLLSGCTAQGSTATLARRWLNSQTSDGMPIGIIYEWKVASGEGLIHTSNMFIKVSSNTVTFYGSTERDPFGGFIRCGGYPCHLREADQIGVIELRPAGDLFTVIRAGGNAGFLKGASCRFESDGLIDRFQCESPSAPFAQGSSTPMGSKSTVNFVQPPG